MDFTSRLARDPVTGKNVRVENITYEQWVNSLSQEQKQALELARKKDSSRTADKLQHNLYKKVLGTKTVPRSFDKFQELKYNETERFHFIKVDYNRQNRLKNDTSLSLPNAEKATADDRKLTHYLFGGEFETGLAKGRAITSRLGYDIDNYEDFKKEILEKTVKYPVKKGETDKYGTRYEQKIIMYGLKGKPANVVVGRKEKDGKTWLTSAYIKEL